MALYWWPYSTVYTKYTKLFGGRTVWYSHQTPCGDVVANLITWRLSLFALMTTFLEILSSRTTNKLIVEVNN